MIQIGRMPTNNNGLSFVGVSNGIEFTSQILSELGRLPELLVNGLNLLDRCHLHYQSMIEDNSNLSILDQLQIGLSYSVLTSLLSAKLLQDIEMTHEAFILSRSILETITMIEYLNIHPEEADNIFKSSLLEETRANQFLFNKIVSKDDEDLKILYKFLCKFSHPTAMTFLSHSSIDGDYGKKPLIKYSYTTLLSLTSHQIKKYLSIPKFISSEEIMKTFIQDVDSTVDDLLKQPDFTFLKK